MILLIFAFPVTIEAAVNEVDTNFDGKPDQWQHVSEKGKLFKVEHDGNFNGKVEQIEFYGASDKLARVEFDRNEDGNIDHFQYYG